MLEVLFERRTITFTDTKMHKLLTYNITAILVQPLNTMQRLNWTELLLIFEESASIVL